MTKPSEGPYTVGDGGYGPPDNCIHDADGRWIAEAHVTDLDSDDATSLPAEANARLLAASWDLLAALKEIRRNARVHLKQAPGDIFATEVLGSPAACRAIAKAEPKP